MYYKAGLLLKHKQTGDVMRIENVFENGITLSNDRTGSASYVARSTIEHYYEQATVTVPDLPPAGTRPSIHKLKTDLNNELRALAKSAIDEGDIAEAIDLLQTAKNLNV